MRVAAPVIGMVLVSQLLAGCFEDAPAADLALSASDGAVTVVNCGPDLGGPMEVRIGETGDEFSNFFVAARSDSWRGGETLTSAAGDWAEVARSGSPTLVRGTFLSVRVLAADGTVVARMRVPEGGAEDGVWLRPAEEPSRTPCTSA